MKSGSAVSVRSGVLAALLAMIFLAAPAVGTDTVDPCASESLEGYVNALLGETAKQTDADAVREAAAAASQTFGNAAAAALRLPNGEGAGGGGLDTYRKLFFALGLGTVTEDDSSLLFDFRPDLLDLGRMGGLSLRATVREAELFEAVLAALAELPGSAGTTRQSELEKGLEDLDDVEYQVRWDSDEHSAFQLAESLFTEMFEASYESLRVEQSAAVQRILEIGADLEDGRSAKELPWAEYCRGLGSADARLAAINERVASVLERTRTLHASLEALHADEIADLLDGEPTWALDVAYRDRAEVAGPSLTTARLQFEVGDRSFAGWRRWAKRRERATDVASFAEFVTRQRPATGGQASLRLLAEYSESERYRFELPEDHLLVERPKARVVSAAVAVGRRLSEGRGTRFDLEARYEDASGDAERNSRFVSTLSWTQKLSDQIAQLAGGSNLVVALVYASRPEYLGEVDKELSLRAGLKWSLDAKERTEQATE